MGSGCRGRVDCPAPAVSEAAPLGNPSWRSWAGQARKASSQVSLAGPFPCLRVRSHVHMRRSRTRGRHGDVTPSQVGTAKITVGCRVQEAAPGPSGVDSSSAESAQRRVKALQKPGGGSQSRRRQVPTVLTQAAPSPRSADTRWRRRVKALQRPGGSAAAQSPGGAESQRF